MQDNALRAVNHRDVSNRRGATVVEFAVVAVPLFLVLFGCIEFGRAMMAIASLEEASRSACRVAILRHATVDDVEAEVNEILGPVGIDSHTVSIEPETWSGAKRWLPISVNVTASLGELSWLPLPRYISDQVYVSSCTLPKEYAAAGE